MDLDHEGVHGEHMIQKHVEVICEDDEDCDENIIIHKEIEISCTDDEEGASCSDKNIWISEGEDFDPEELHEKHKGEETHKVIVIKKEINPED